MLDRADLDRLLGRVDITAIVQRVDVNLIVEQVDVNEVIGKVDVEAVVDRVDVNAVVDRIDIDALVEQTDLGAVIAASSGGVASDALDVVRSQTVGLDEFIARRIGRLRRALHRPARHPAGRAALGIARRDRPDGGHLFVGRAGGAAAVPVPGLIRPSAVTLGKPVPLSRSGDDRVSAAHEVAVVEVAGRPSGSGRASAAARVRSLLAAALHGAQEHSYAITQDCEVAEHLDDEHHPGCLGFGADVPETHR